MKESDPESFDYNSMWQSEEEKLAQRELRKMKEEEPKPRKLEGKWLKRKGHVTKNQIKYSYMRGIKDLKGENNYQFYFYFNRVKYNIS